MAAKVAEELPTAPFIYFGDTKYVPYGARSASEVVALIARICHYLVEQGATSLVMACNTSSALAYDEVVKWCPVPVIGIIEAAAKTAAGLSRNGRIGVISNVLTAQSGAYARAVKRYNASAVVFPQGCPKLVPLVEKGCVSGPEAEAALHEYIDPLLERGIDTLVFGCTHYPFFRETLEKMTEGRLTLVDPAVYVAEELRSRGYGEAQDEGTRRYVVSGDPQHFAQVAQQLLGLDLGEVEKALD